MIRGSLAGGDESHQGRGRLKLGPNRDLVTLHACLMNTSAIFASYQRTDKKTRGLQPIVKYSGFAVAKFQDDV